jgi:hypothetical protein
MAGRPPLYETPEKLQAAIEDYFMPCATEEVTLECGKKETITLNKREPRKSVTITGLAYHLGFESRQSFYDYEEKPEYSYIIKRARLLVEMSYEERLMGQACTGAIFALKNMGWKDKVEQEQYGKDGGPIQNETKHTVEFHDYSKNGYQTKV